MSLGIAIDGHVGTADHPTLTSKPVISSPLRSALTNSSIRSDIAMIHLGQEVQLRRRESKVSELSRQSPAPNIPNLQLPTSSSDFQLQVSQVAARPSPAKANTLDSLPRHPFLHFLPTYSTHPAPTSRPPPHPHTRHSRILLRHNDPNLKHPTLIRTPLRTRNDRLPPQNIRLIRPQFQIPQVLPRQIIDLQSATAWSGPKGRPGVYDGLGVGWLTSLRMRFAAVCFVSLEEENLRLLFLLPFGLRCVV